jgi:hypothetical protein
LERKIKRADAEAKRLRASEAEAERDSDGVDVEGEALRLLTKVRQAIVGEIRDAESIEAARAALGACSRISRSTCPLGTSRLTFARTQSS